MSDEIEEFKDRIDRTPERRTFHIDVGNLPKGEAEEYVKELMKKYKNKGFTNE